MSEPTSMASNDPADLPSHDPSVAASVDATAMDDGSRGPTMPEPAAIPGWAPPTDDPGRTFSRRSLVVAWVASLTILVLFAAIRARRVDGSDAYRFGTLVGGIVGALVLVLVVRLIVMKLRRRPARDAWRSPWLPVGAALLVTFAGVSSLFRTTAMAVDPESRLRIESSWVMDTSYADTIEQIESAILAQGEARDVVVRYVQGPDGTAGFLTIADAALQPDADLGRLAEGMMAGTGAAASIETVGQTEVAIVRSDEVTVLAWMEPPLLLFIHAADRDSARLMAEAVLAADT